MRLLKNYTIFLLFSALFFSCKNRPEASNDEDAASAETITPVTVTAISNDTLSNFILLNATSAFLQKSYVKSNINGYIKSVNTQIGKYVSDGENLFSLKTKESESIGNSISILDSTFKFSGTSNIKANGDGYITELNHQAGDYVQDGEQLAVISNMNSFAFLLDLPYELRGYLMNQKTVGLELPGGEKLEVIVSSLMPAVDSVSQTQRIILKVHATHPIPENLIAKVKIIKALKANALSLPKQCVLSDETENNFWVMKMINDSVAVKVPVTKGIETDARIEILSPVFSADDKIILTGNYGLEDTAKVKIE